MARVTDKTFEDKDGGEDPGKWINLSSSECDGNGIFLICDGYADRQNFEDEYGESWKRFNGSRSKRCDWFQYQRNL